MKHLYRLHDYVDKYVGADCLIVGSAPTRYDYSDLSTHNGPIVFINDAIKVAHYAKQPKYFCSLHPDKFVPEINSDEFVVILPKTHLPSMMDSSILIYNWQEQNEITPADIKTNTIYSPSNSTIPAVYFFELTGAKRIKFVGASPIDGEFSHQHDLRLGGDIPLFPAECFQGLVRTCDSLGIEAVFL